jgi:hypothetical protein
MTPSKTVGHNLEEGEGEGGSVLHFSGYFRVFARAFPEAYSARKGALGLHPNGEALLITFLGSLS